MNILRDENKQVIGFAVSADEDNIQKMWWVKKSSE
jgi:hypothetical protein